MIDIQQVKQDYDNGILISKATWGKVIEMAMGASIQPTGEVQRYSIDAKGLPYLDPEGVWVPYAPPVSAPVPEAEAEQVTDEMADAGRQAWLKSMQGVLIQSAEESREKFRQAFLAMFAVTPAVFPPTSEVKHEASELPKIPHTYQQTAKERAAIYEYGQECVRAARQAPSIAVPAANVGALHDSKSAIGLLLRAKSAIEQSDPVRWSGITYDIDNFLAAPTVSSIGNDAEFVRLMLNYNNAQEQHQGNVPTMLPVLIRSAIVQYIDARSHVAAESHALALEALSVFDSMLVGCHRKKFGDYQNGDGETIGPAMDALHKKLKALAK